MQSLFLLAHGHGGPATSLEWILRSEGWFLWLQAPMALVMLTLVLSALDLTRRRVVMPKRLRRLLDEAIHGNAPAAAVSRALRTSRPIQTDTM